MSLFYTCAQALIIRVLEEFILSKNVANLLKRNSVTGIFKNFKKCLFTILFLVSPFPHPSLKQAITCHKKLGGN